VCGIPTTLAAIHAVSSNQDVINAAERQEEGRTHQWQTLMVVLTRHLGLNPTEAIAADEFLHPCRMKRLVPFKHCAE